MPVKEKKQKNAKKTMLTVLKILIIAVLVIAVVATVFIEIVTRPQKDTDADLVCVGGTVISDSIDYSDEATKKLQRNRIMKMMEMIWYFCADGDAKKHEDQTPPDTQAIKDIPYIDDGNIYHRLDVFYPKSLTPDEKLPVIIDIHGGGWMYGSKDLNEYYCRALADRGFVVFSISYRLVPDVTVKEQLQDVMQALNWISENKSAYPCAEDIMLTGDSAGGMLASYSAVLLRSPEMREVFGTVSADLDISALLLTSPVPFMKEGAISVYTKLCWGEDYRKKDTYNYMNLDEIIDYAPDFPPTYLITSSGDSLAHSQTLKTAELLESKGINTELKDYEKYNGKSLQHVYSVLFPFDEPGNEMIDGAIDFYRQIINEE
ncbi:MAG: alpha/beta hydrolase [Eubacterium sp.]